MTTEESENFIHRKIILTDSCVLPFVGTKEVGFQQHGEPHRERVVKYRVFFHPANQGGLFDASHQPAHTAGRCCRLSP